MNCSRRNCLKTCFEESRLSAQVQAVFSRILSTNGNFVNCLFLSYYKQGLGINDETIKNVIEDISIVATSSGLTNNVTYRILYMYLIGEFLPDEVMLTILDTLLRRIGDNTIQYNDHVIFRLISYFLHQSRVRISWPTLDITSAARFTSSLLNAWMTANFTSFKRKFFLTFVLDMERSLCSSFSHWCSSFALYEHDSEALIQRCLETTNSRTIDSVPSDVCLLATIISLDPIQFTPAFLNVHKKLEHGEEYRRAMVNGLLDHVLDVVLECHDILHMYQQEILSIIGLFHLRMSMVLVDMSLLDNCHHFFSVILKLLRNSNFEARTDQIVLENVALQLFQQKHEDGSSPFDCIPFSTREEAVQVVIRICKRSKSDDVAMMKPLSSLLLVYLCETLTRSLRNLSNPHEKSSALRLITGLRELFSTDLTFDSNHFKDKGISFLKSLVKACLRLGIRIDNDCTDNIRLSCLDLVRSIVMMMHTDTSSGPCLGTVFKQSMASEVFTMVTAHSKFDHLMNSNGCDDLQLEVLRIIRTCLFFTTNIAFDEHVWLSLLACFGAGVVEKDLLLRDILFEYGRQDTKVCTLFIFCFLWQLNLL
jgi:hypothetical protein